MSNMEAKAIKKVASEEETTDISCESRGRISEEVTVNRVGAGGKEEKVLVSIRARVGGAKLGVRWTADSGVSRSLLSEEDWSRWKAKNPALKLRENRTNFRPYGTSYTLPMLGKAKVVLKSRAGAKVDTMVYVVRGQSESLLGKLDGQKLGIISIAPEGDTEEGSKSTSEVKQEVRKEGIIGEEVVVNRAETGGTEDTVLVSIRPGAGGNKMGLGWIADSGVNRSLVSEEDWNRLKDRIRH